MRAVRLFHPLSLVVAALALAAVVQPLRAADVVRLNGAGASFPAPLYQRWFRDYFLSHPSVHVDYQTIGSGAGIATLAEGRIDFAGSDQPISAEEAEAIDAGIVQFPMTAGAVVMAYHLPGIDDLKLSRQAIAGIFLGQVARWNDPLIAASNTGVELPDLPITVVARADSSGTSYVATRHLSAISEEFAEAVGTTMKPVWPEALKERGALIRGQGNGGTAAYIKAVPGAIGYVQYAYSYLPGMQMASLQNQAGELVPPRSDTFEAAVQSFRAELDLSQVADPRGAGAYPILTLSWIIVRNDLEEAKARVLKDVLRYGLTEGQDVAERLGYIPLTEESIRGILKKIESLD